MKLLLTLESAAFLMIGIFAFTQTGLSWWWFAGLFFAPDVSMLGYLVNNKAGAFAYNLFHHLGVAILVFVAGKYFSVIELELSGIILFSHSAFDRILGYGLKYEDSFHHTHLGRIGKP
ncbi:conserved hypothetical protein, membrane [Flavobacteriaceae bacterium 3519-10]|nr:conserved hypothetical protein, membrane [Flavobacteriaceae bacterium 3519-10]